MCSRSVPAAPCAWGTTVARVTAPARVAESDVGPVSEADTPRNSTAVVALLGVAFVDCTTMSNNPSVGRLEICMETVVPVSVSNEIVRVWTSPPKRRAARRVHGVEVWVEDGWSRRTRKRAAWAKSSAEGSARGGSNSSRYFYPVLVRLPPRSRKYGDDIQE